MLTEKIFVVSSLCAFQIQICSKVFWTPLDLPSAVLAVEAKGEERLHKLVAIRREANCYQCKPLCTVHAMCSKFQSIRNKRDNLSFLFSSLLLPVVKDPFTFNDFWNAMSGFDRAYICFSLQNTTRIFNKKFQKNIFFHSIYTLQ